MTIVSSAIIAGGITIYGFIEAAIGTIVGTFVLAGLFMVLIGLSRVGQYI